MKKEPAWVPVVAHALAHSGGGQDGRSDLRFRLARIFRRNQDKEMFVDVATHLMRLTEGLGQEHKAMIYNDMYGLLYYFGPYDAIVDCTRLIMSNQPSGGAYSKPHLHLLKRLISHDKHTDTRNLFEDDVMGGAFAKVLRQHIDDVLSTICHDDTFFYLVGAKKINNENVSQVWTRCLMRSSVRSLALMEEYYPPKMNKDFLALYARFINYTELDYLARGASRHPGFNRHFSFYLFEPFNKYRDELYDLYSRMTPEKQQSLILHIDQYYSLFGIETSHQLGADLAKHRMKQHVEQGTAPNKIKKI